MNKLLSDILTRVLAGAADQLVRVAFDQLRRHSAGGDMEAFVIDRLDALIDAACRQVGAALTAVGAHRTCSFETYGNLVAAAFGYSSGLITGTIKKTTGVAIGDAVHALLENAEVEAAVEAKLKTSFEAMVAGSLPSFP